MSDEMGPIPPRADDGFGPPTDQVGVPAPMRSRGYPGIPLTAMPWTLGMAFIVAGMFLGGAGLLVAIGRFTSAFEIRGTAGVVVRFGSLLLPYAIALVFVALVLRKHALGWAEGVGLRRSDGAGIGAAFGVAFLGRFAAGVLVMIPLAFRLTPPDNLDFTQLFPVNAPGVAALTFIVVVAGPIVEEIMFRGVVLSAFRDRWGDGVAVFASAAVFALFHFSIWNTLPTFVLGLGLAWLFISTRSLWTSIIAHVSFNLIAVIAAYGLRALKLQ